MLHGIKCYFVARFRIFVPEKELVSEKYLVTITGIVATMPYIALQLLGIQVVIGALGISGTGLAADLPLIIA